MTKGMEADLSLNELKENKIDTGIFLMNFPLRPNRLNRDAETRFSYWIRLRKVFLVQKVLVKNFAPSYSHPQLESSCNLCYI